MRRLPVAVLCVLALTLVPAVAVSGAERVEKLTWRRAMTHLERNTRRVEQQIHQTGAVSGCSRWTARKVTCFVTYADEVNLILTSDFVTVVLRRGRVMVIDSFPS